MDEVGEEVENVQIGDKVVTLHWAPCGTCFYCSQGKTTQCAHRQE